MEINLLAPEARGVVRELYDEESGYGKNLEISRAHFRRQDECGPSELLESGVEKLRVISEADAAEMCGKIDDHLLKWSDKDEILAILEAVITPEIDARAISYFESEYLPTTVGFRRMEVNRDDVSSRWHCDHGPSKHLIVMVYFTPSEPDGNANTHFLDRRFTDTMKEIGYVFGDPQNRIGDDYMAALADHFKIDFKPRRFVIEPGNAIMFDAPNILHRGAYPRIAPRYSMEVSLVPSPVDWRTACQRTAFPIRSDLINSYPPVDWSLV